MTTLRDSKHDIFNGPNHFGDVFAVDRRNPFAGDIHESEITLWINGHYGTLTPDEAEKLMWFLKQAIANQL